MGDRMIRVEHVSKEYQLGVIGQKIMLDKADSPLGKRLTEHDLHEGRINDKGMFMALSDISFEVEAGETLGIIGRNGAGKSTLLKLLARITLPTVGRILLNGHVASMIEVGTGFHSELTGRENIYLKGAMLGMSERKIDQKLDEIVDFSECGQFLDTPVKRYSSGMYLKLGLSVAAYLDAEIVVMDEVLAVGDTAFQNKCIQKIKEMSESGRTILFVSHNMALIRSLCKRCIVLDQGKLKFDGKVEEAIRYYTSASFYMEQARELEQLERTPSHNPNRVACMTYIKILGRTRFAMREILRFMLRFRLLERVGQLCLRVGIWSADGTAAAISFVRLPNACEGENETYFRMDTSRLLPGKYSLELLLVDMDKSGLMVKLDALRDVIAFEILPSEDWPVYQMYKRDWGYVELPLFIE